MLLCISYGESIGMVRESFLVLLGRKYLHRFVFYIVFYFNPWSTETFFARKPVGLNVFNQYFGRDFGFNEEEVIELVGHLPGHKVESIMDFYPGYCHGNQSHLFNPYSVMQVLLNKGAIKPYWPNKEDVQVFNKALKMYFKQDYKVLMAGKVLPNLYLSQKLKLSEIIEPENLLEMLIYNGYLSARPSHTKVIPMKKKALGLKFGGPDKNKNETLMATITFHNVSIPNQEILMAFHKIIRKEKRDKKKETENEAEE
uniref:Uncharacterized protein n=1 Tax=Cacopsylla melanoneura TaxID=428564 RepID=A0A8D8YQ99_9HEMI